MNRYTPNTPDVLGYAVAASTSAAVAIPTALVTYLLVTWLRP